MIRIGVLGAGNMGHHHMRAYDLLSHSLFSGQISLEAVCDVDAHRAQEAARRFNIPQVFTDSDKAIENELVDALIIATPPSEHFSQAMRALSLGKPIYCEKPLGLGPEQARTLADYASLHGVSNQSGLVLRHSPLILKIQEILARGDLGEIQSVDFETHSQSPWTCGRYRTPFRTSRANSGGGILHEENIHDIDTFAALFGALTIGEVTLTKDATYDIESAVEARFTLPTGAPLSYRSRWINEPTPPQRNLIIRGTKGRLSASYFVLGSLDVKTADSTVSLSESDLTGDHLRQQKLECLAPHLSTYSVLADRAFVLSIMSKTPCSPDLQDCASAEKTIESMYQSAVWRTA